MDLRFGSRLKHKNTISRRAYSKLLDFFEERLRTILNIKLYVSEEKDYKRYEKISGRLMEADVSQGITEGISATVSDFFYYLTLAFVIGFGGFLVFENMLSIGSLVAVYAYVYWLLSPIQRISELYISTKENQVSAQRVSNLLDSLKTEDTGAEQPAEDIIGQIAFEKVTFSYGRKKILENLDLKLTPGKLYCIVGESGSGKTTILHLIYRLYRQDSGKITLDGKDISRYNLFQYRSQVAISEAEPALVNDTIRNNLSYSKKHTLKEIQRAARLADIHGFINNLPKKYDTRIGEIDTEISEGQKQRLALARLILKESKIMLFDESTSSLDADSEQKMLETIKKLSKDNCIAMVTHRLSTMEAADEIIVLDKGRVAEQGPFDRLMRLKGKFFEYYSLENNGFYEFTRKIKKNKPIYNLHIKNAEEREKVFSEILKSFKVVSAIFHPSDKHKILLQAYSDRYETEKQLSSIRGDIKFKTYTIGREESPKQFLERVSRF